MAPPAALIIMLLAAPLAAGVVTVQAAKVLDPAGCPAQLAPSPGTVRLRPFYESARQRDALGEAALATYLSDRLGRPVRVANAEQADPTGFRIVAALQPLSTEVLVFLADDATLGPAPGRHNQQALGLATHGTACAYVSFLPEPAAACSIGGQQVEVQPAYATLAHELGHLLGLGHHAQGLMGAGAYKPCASDTLSASELAIVRGWGR